MVDHNEAIRRKYWDDIQEAKKLGNVYDPDMQGRFPWRRSETRGKTTTLTKASLGEFCFAVLSCGGRIYEIWPFNPNYKRSAVFYSVSLSLAQKKHLEETTEYRFDPPQFVKLAESKGV